MQMYRLFYYASRKAPIAITLSRRFKFAEQPYPVEERFLITEGQMESVETFAQAGKSIERMEQEAKKICNFLSRAYGFRVLELVADFVRDKHDVFWLTNVRSFVLEESNYNVKRLEYEKVIENQAVVLEQLREQANDSSNASQSPQRIATCRLCGFRFNRARKGRRVTAHTLLELREHLRRRGITLSINFKVKAEEFLSHSVTVCELCYSVAIAEHHLMNIEREFARAQAIPVKIQNVPIDIARNKDAPSTVVQPVLPTLVLQQWRVLFYFSYLINSKTSRQSIDETLKLPPREYYLQFRFFEHITKFPLDVAPGSPRRRLLHLPLDFIRVHYFFSVSKDINATLKDLIVDLRITEGESWDRVLFSGKSLSLHDFISDYCSLESILLPKCVSLFSPDVSRYVTLQVCLRFIFEPSRRS